MLRKLIAKFRGFYYQLILAREAPNRIASGIAIGVFIAWSPLLGIHTVLCILLAFVFKASKTASILGSLLCNPLTIPFILFIDYEVGILICNLLKINYTHMILSDFKNIDLLKTGMEVLVPALIGSFVLGIVNAVPAYFLSKIYFTKIFNEQKNLS